MQNAVTRKTLEAWNDDVTVPKIVNKTVLKKILKDNFNQVSDQSVDLMEITVYSIVTYLSNSVKQMHGGNRLTPERLRDALLRDDIINLNYGSITVVNESVEVSEARIASRVIEMIAGKKVIQKVKEEEVDYEELINDLGEENVEQKDE